MKLSLKLFATLVAVFTLIVSACQKKADGPPQPTLYQLANSNGTTGSTTTGGTTTGSTTGANPSVGYVMFWTKSDLGCGNIAVIMNSQRDTISNFYPSGPPSCGAGGCATFSLVPGTYGYSASCFSHYWSATSTATNAVVISAGSCRTIQLTL